MPRRSRDPIADDGRPFLHALIIRRTPTSVETAVVPVLDLPDYFAASWVLIGIDPADECDQTRWDQQQRMWRQR